jgi:hypothetical protein
VISPGLFLSLAHKKMKPRELSILSAVLLAPSRRAVLKSSKFQGIHLLIVDRRKGKERVLRLPLAAQSFRRLVLVLVIEEK